MAPRGSAEDQTCVMKMSSSEYMFIVDAMLVLNARDGAYSRYYIYSARADHIGGSMTVRPH